MRRLQLLVLMALLFGVGGCDYATKELAGAHLQGKPPVAVVPGVLDLRYTQNTDSGFSLLGGWLGHETRYWVLCGLAVLAVLGIILYLVRRWRALSLGQTVAGAVLLAGALGNQVERALRGYVTDFVHLHHWPVFNVADVALCVGIGLLLLSGSGREPPPASRDPAARLKADDSSNHSLAGTRMRATTSSGTSTPPPRLAVGPFREARTRPSTA